MAVLALSILSGIIENALELFRDSKLRFFEHFLLDLESLAYLAQRLITSLNRERGLNPISQYSWQDNIAVL